MGNSGTDCRAAAAALLMAVAAATVARGSELRVTNARIEARDEKTAVVVFDIEWSNSWRYKDVNHDAAWVFFKARPESGGEWRHVKLARSGVNPEGCDTGDGTPVEIFVPEDCAGLFVRRLFDGAGAISVRNVQAVCDLAASGLEKGGKVRERAFGVEMVYVPDGAFWAGNAGGVIGDSFRDARDENAAARIDSSDGRDLYWGPKAGNKVSLPAAYPNGFAAFYCMKYELTQGFYGDFLNTLNRAQQEALAPPGHTVIRRSEIVAAAPEPIEFGCDGNNNKLFDESDDGRSTPMQGSTRAASLAVAAWSGLRPMTELEYEKACRGFAAPVAGEFAWGSTTIPAQNAYLVTTNSTRESSGLSYWGIANLSGPSRGELVMSAANGSPSLFTGRHGDGALGANGAANVVGWPDATKANMNAGGVRGGSAWNGQPRWRVADRGEAANPNAPAELRGVRSAPAGLGGKGTPPPEIFRGEPAQPGTPPFHALNGLRRHGERLAPFSVRWLTVAVGRDFRRVYPHPILPDRVVVVARGGLFLSEDCARTWRTLDKGGATLGDVLDLAFSPAVPDEFAVATSEKGVWLTSDAGRSFRRIGSRAQGMAADHAVCVVYDIDNPRFDSLLVGHGEGGAGMSRTYDGGRTWQVLYPALEFYRIGPKHWQSRSGFLVDVVDRKKGDAHRLYRCVNVGEILEEMKADVLPSDLATSRVLRGSSSRPVNEELGASWKYLDAPVFVATEDDGVYRLDNSGLMRCGPSGARSFSSLDVTYGRHADQQYLLAYSPREGGLWVTTDARTSWYWNDIIGIDGMGPISKQHLVEDYKAEWTAVDDGIAVGNGVQSGAHIRANAGGTRLYAVANGMLRVGTVDTGPCVISRVKITPPVIWVRPREFGMLDANRKPQGTVPAAMFCRPGDYGEAPSVGGVEGSRDWVSLTDILVTVETAPSGARARYVTVDLSRLRGEALVRLYDDGAHEDGAAGDGVFAARCTVDPQALCHTSLDGRVVWSQTVEQNVPEAIEARGIAGSDEVGNYDRGSGWRVACGQVGLTARAVGEDGEVSGAVGVLGLHPLISRVVLSRATEMTLFAGSDSWCPVRQGPGKEKTADVWLASANAEGMDFLRFEIKAEGEASAGDVRVRLRDRPPSQQRHETAPVGLVAGGYIPAPGPNAEYVTVSIPLTDMLKSSPDFIPKYLKWVSISAEGGVYKVRNLRLETAYQGQGQSSY